MINPFLFFWHLQRNVPKYCESLTDMICPTWSLAPVFGAFEGVVLEPGVQQKQWKIIKSQYD